MLKQVHIRNFRALKDVEFSLAPLTVLVGPNASGKSSILRALETKPLSPGDLWGRASAGRATVGWVATDGSAGVWEATPTSATGAALNAQVLRLDLRKLREPNYLAKEQVLLGDGSNLANVFATLTRQQQTALAAELCSLVPVFQDVETEPTGNGNHQLRFLDRWNPDVWYGPNEVSDGSMLVTALLTAKFQRPMPKIIAIEEPERGIHPYLLGELVKTMRKLNAAGVQLVLATHSAELLDHVLPEEVRFVTKLDTTGEVQVGSVDTSQAGWEHAYEEHRRSLASIWLSGSVGGVPG